MRDQSGEFFFLLLMIALIIILGAWIIIFLALYIPAYFAGWKMYRKMNIAGWKYLIPYYGDYVLFKKLWEVKYFWIALLPSVVSNVLTRIAGHYRESDMNVYLILGGCAFAILMVSIVIHFFLYRRLAWAFDKGDGFAFGLTVIPPLFIVILGFGKARYIYAKKEKKQLKKQQKNT